MTERIRAKFFLTEHEREKLWSLVDGLEDAELEDMESEQMRLDWMRILLRLLLGKKGIPPLYIKGTVEGRPDEGSD